MSQRHRRTDQISGYVRKNHVEENCPLLLQFWATSVFSRLLQGSCLPMKKDFSVYCVTLNILLGCLWCSSTNNNVVSMSTSRQCSVMVAHTRLLSTGCWFLSEYSSRSNFSRSAPRHRSCIRLHRERKCADTMGTVPEKCMDAILSNSTGKLLWFEITKMLIVV